MRSIILVLIFSVVSILPGLAQSSNRQPEQTFPQPMGGNPPTVDTSEPAPTVTHEMEKRLAEERETQLKSDTDKLLKLSQELKAYVDKTNQNVLSLDVVRKADEIEKLAKSVKDKMKGPN